MNRAEEYRLFCASYPVQQAVVDGVRWEYIEAGSGGETLLLLPGGFGVADTSFRLIRAFAPDFRVISVTYPPAITTFVGLVDGVAGLLKQLNVSTAHVLGGSASGLIAQGFVRRHPTLVCSLVLSHTGMPQPWRARWLAPTVRLVGMLPFGLVQRAFHASVQAFLPNKDAEHEFWRAYFHQRINELSPAAFWSRFRVLIDADRSVHFAPNELDTWPGSILLICSENDGFVTKREQAALRRLYPQAQEHCFPRGVHRDSVAAPEAEIAIIRAFLG